MTNYPSFRALKYVLADAFPGTAWIVWTLGLSRYHSREFTDRIWIVKVA